MVGLLITGHGEFAAGMQSAAKMIAGECEVIKYVKFLEGMSTEQLADQLFRLLGGEMFRRTGH